MSALDDFLALNVSTKDFAKIVNMTERGVRQWITQGIVPVKSQKPYRINVKEGLYSYLSYVKDRKNDGPETPTDDDKAKSEKLRADADISIAKARQEELKLNELKGLLHRSEDVQAMTEDLIYMIRGAITALPGKLAIDLAAEDNPNKCSAIIREQVALVLDGLSEYEYSRERYKARMKERLGTLEPQKDEDDEE